MSFEEARAIVTEQVRPVEATETVRLDYLLHRVIAADYTTAVNVPSFSRAVRDGYAIRSCDVAGASQTNPAVLEITGAVYAGDLPGYKVTRGTCVRIATGAVLPKGADAAVKIEDTEAEGLHIRISHQVQSGENTGTTGEDVKKDAYTLPKGTVLDANKIALIAAQGKTRLEVYKRPRVAVLPSGNELVSPGKRARRGQVYDSNSYGVAAVIDANGGEALTAGIAGDRPDIIRGMIAEGLKHDMTVICGGSSAGDRDLTAGVLAGWGKILFHGVRMLPGKSVLFALVDGKPLFGLPGNPSACLMCAHLFVMPAVRKMARMPDPGGNTMTLPLAHDFTARPGPRQFIPVIIENEKVIPAPQEAGAITTLARSAGYISIPETTRNVMRGTPVTVTLF